MGVQVMTERLAALQALVVGLLFAWAGLWKACFPRARALAAQSALATLLSGRRRAQAAHLAVGVGELAIAALLLLPPARWWAMRLATAFALGFLGYLGLAWRVAPDKPCACLGGRATRVSRRSLARAGAVLLLTLLGWPARAFWGAALVSAPWTALVVALELGGLWLLSPEFGWTGARVERRVVRALRLRLNPTCRGAAFDWVQMERRVRRTALFRELVERRSHLGARTDRWREGCSGYIAYEARYQGRPATAVITFPVLFEPTGVSAAVVDDARGAVVLKLVPASGA